MRIVGEISHPILKITIFLHDSKYSVKFEAGLYEMTYKFRSGNGIDSVAAIKDIIDQQFIDDIMITLPKLHEQKLNAIKRWKEERDKGFEKII